MLWRFHSVHLADNFPSLLSLGRLCSELGYSIRGRQQDLPEYLIWTIIIESTVGTFVLKVAVAKRSVVPFLDSSLAMDENLSRRDPKRTMHLPQFRQQGSSMRVVQEKHSEERLLSVVTGAE